MIKLSTILIIAAVAVFIFFFVIPIAPGQQQNNLVMKYFDGEGNLLGQDSVPLESQSILDLQSVAPEIGNLPNVPAEASIVEFSIVVTNTGNVPIMVSIINAEVEGVFRV
jgi:hypothetical protein